MIKAILFDFDGVLTIDKTGSQSIINFIVSKTNIPYEIFKTNYYKYNKGLLNGEYTHKDIWLNLCQDIGIEIDYSILLEAFENTVLDEDMIMFVKQLKNSYKIGMITDNKIDRIDAISKSRKFDEMFDIISVSADCKSGKDSNIIFNKTIDFLKVLPNECIFIDNTPENLIIPQIMGMKTILFDDEIRDIDIFKNLLYSYII